MKRTLRLIIAGGRSYQLTDEDYRELDALRSRIEEVVTGGAFGADFCGKMWAKANRIAIREFPADWATHGKAAGPLRNKLMAGYANAAILFPGGRGTDSMYREAVKAKLLIFDHRQ